MNKGRAQEPDESPKAVHESSDQEDGSDEETSFEEPSSNEIPCALKGNALRFLTPITIRMMSSKYRIVNFLLHVVKVKLKWFLTLTYIGRPTS